jgi:hypothetical protein
MRFIRLFAMAIVPIALLSPVAEGGPFFGERTVFEDPGLEEDRDLPFFGDGFESEGPSVREWVEEASSLSVVEPLLTEESDSLLKTTPFGAATDCAPTQYRILQTICGPGVPTQALIDFENEAIAQWLAERGLEPSEQQKLYEYGRSDVRSQLREHLLHKLLERARFSEFSYDPATYWFMGLIWGKEKALYQKAVDDKALFLTDLCAWRPNASVALQYKLKFDHAAWCSGGSNLIVLFKTPLIPTKSYFLGAALQDVYLHNTAEIPGAAAIALQMLNQTAELLGLSAIGGIALNAGTYGAAYKIPKVKKFIFPKNAKSMERAAKKAVRESIKVLPKIHNKVTSTLLKGGLKLLKGGPLFVISLAFEAGMAAGQRAFEQDETYKDIKSLDTDLARLKARSTPPSITPMIDDDTGMLKLRTAFMDLTLPEMESTTPLPAIPEPEKQLTFAIANAGEEPYTSEATFSYVDWDENEFDTYVVDGWFVSDGTIAGDEERVTTFTPIIKYQNEDEKPYTLGMFAGRHFAVSRDSDFEGITCPPDILTGVSEPPLGVSLADCASYVADEIMVLQEDGSIKAISIPSPPHIVAPDRIAFTRTVPREVEIGFAGFPTPTLVIQQGSLPAGVTLEPVSAGKAKFVYDGVGADATQAITLRAQRGNTTDDFTITIYVRTAPAITSPGGLSLTVGKAVDFTVTTTGSLPIALAMDSGILPPGLTFKDNGDGTASIKGTYGGEFITSRCLPLEHPCGILATPDVLEPVRQSFGVSINAAPKPAENTGQLILGNNEWIAGVENEKVLVNSAATLTPVHYLLRCSPTWLSLVDHGDGTATLKGTPPRVANVTTETFRVEMWANGDGSGGTEGFFPLCNDGVRIHSAKIVPRFRYTDDQYTGTLIAGESGASLIEVNQLLTDASVQLSGYGYLPPGVTFNPSSGSQFVSFSGTPPANSGGLYPYEVTATNPFITETLPFQLIVKERPKIITEAQANFASNQTSSFLIQAIGYPLTTMAFSVVGNLPGTVTLQQEAHAPYATLTGNPGFATGDYPVTIIARNDPDASFVDQQSFVLHVGPGGDANSDKTLSCLDYSFVRALFGKRRGHVGFDPRADLNGDDLVDLRDLAIVLRLLELGGGGPCV